MEDPAKKYFSSKVSDKERAAFEAGIALGMVVHQFSGIPIKFREEVEYLRKVIEYAVKSQPFKVDAKIYVDIDINGDSSNPYKYITLRSRHLDARVTVEYGRAVVKARLRYIPELDYTLAYIEDISEK
ncbi:MAG: dihydroneopterin aldolase family protein [Sulfolobales archaeon]|nr:dihydroneopterin aldolase family protein [Sulfolobales archaeon]MCX8199167.1 dihydroneopterin aldolase family protein [Sulfolobales archaeon]MDW8170147.1 dihydroneopterin aldolase family protein [Desulfurococcaceae archaeon]